jgi:hypothetical protein
MSAAYLIIFIFVAVEAIYIYRYSFSKINTDRCTHLDPNATIVGIRSENDNWGKFKHIRTIVTFSDGSEYHTHKTRQEPSFGGYRMIVDTEVIEEIAEKAVIAHHKKAAKS